MAFPEHVWPQTAAIVEDHLSIDGVTLAELAAQFGTPLYLFDEVTLREACRSYRRGFERYPAEVHFSYASKAILNRAIGQILLEEGFGFDVVSLGELQMAMAAGARPEACHLHGNAKPAAELERAIELGVGRIAVDNLDELNTLAGLTDHLVLPQAIILRIEPAVAAETHASIQTGQKGSKFGLSLTQLDALIERLKTAPGLKLVGLHFHLGSQLFDLADYDQAVNVLLDLMLELKRNHQIEIEELSPGGGLAAAYVPSDLPPDPEAFGRRLSDFVVDGCQTRGLDLPKLVLEPGRSITARPGVALYRVLGRKPIRGAAEADRYIHLDGGMGDNLRPSLYGAKYAPLLANRISAPTSGRVHLSGRYCESGDLLAKALPFPDADVGDLIAFPTAGAYTISMSNNYNLVPRPAVVMIHQGEARLIQRRETFEDLIARDVIPGEK